LSFLFLLLIIIIGVTFATLNSDTVTIHYYIGNRVIPLSLLLVIVLTIGSALGMMVGFWLVLKAKLRIYRLKQRLKLAEKEIENLRAIPLKDKH
jgi:putative membrane protein